MAWSLQQMLGVCRHGVFPSKPSRFGDGGLCLWAPVRQSGQWWWAGRRVWQRQMASAEFFGWRWRGLEEWSVQAPLGVVDLHAWLGLAWLALLCAALRCCMLAGNNAALALAGLLLQRCSRLHLFSVHPKDFKQRDGQAP